MEDLIIILYFICLFLHHNTLEMSSSSLKWLFFFATTVLDMHMTCLPTFMQHIDTVLICIYIYRYCVLTFDFSQQERTWHCCMPTHVYYYSLHQIEQRSFLPRVIMKWCQHWCLVQNKRFPKDLEEISLNVLYLNQSNRHLVVFGLYMMYIVVIAVVNMNDVAFK